MAAALLAVLSAAALAWGGSRLLADDADPGRSALAGVACEPGADGARRPLEGFGEVAFQVDAPDGTERAGCALLAATADARAEGLMGQRDLRGYDAMAFRFDEPTTGRFYMYRTLVPLGIAFVDADGEVVRTTVMAPCPAEEPADCPTYGAEVPYLHALEVLDGGLEPLGLVPGATVTFADQPG